MQMELHQQHMRFRAKRLGVMAQSTQQISTPEFARKVAILVCDFEDLNPKLQSPIVPRDISRSGYDAELLRVMSEKMPHAWDIEFVRD
jgi:hypothetical protein